MGLQINLKSDEFLVKRYLDIGSEAVLKENIKIINNFMYELIRNKREQMKDGKLYAIRPIKPWSPARRYSSLISNPKIINYIICIPKSQKSRVRVSIVF
ncbi:hypothetical protein L1887_00601 [Cichorium endivia]|nr:hypothetical protein L1887_00601 [Cichorium endivia]